MVTATFSLFLSFCWITLMQTFSFSKVHSNQIFHFLTSFEFSLKSKLLIKDSLGLILFHFEDVSFFSEPVYELNHIKHDYIEKVNNSDGQCVHPIQNNFKCIWFHFHIIWCYTVYSRSCAILGKIVFSVPTGL